MRRAILSVLLAAVCVLTGIYGAAASRPAEPEFPGPEGIIPPVTVSHANRTLDLTPWSWCWGGKLGCIDGFPPATIPYLDVLNGPVTIEFPGSGWDFRAYFVSIAGEPVDVYNCATVTLAAEVEEVGENTWQFTPRGPAGPYRVDVIGTNAEGSDAEGSDVEVSFIATTTTDHPWPPSIASAMVLAEANPTGRFRFIVQLSRLPARQWQAAADIVLIGEDGEHVITANADPSNDDCDLGYVNLRASVRAGPVMNKIGDPPYHIRYEVRLDGERHVATTGWPPYADPPRYGLEQTPLEFDPALPFGPA